ncbi:hypothetical protein VP496E541_P0123 [Vibrio phage 496E54-1]|nr:hypothetical protein VP495E541_P0124 [Vibrio phage 495E54-1]CAH9013761.1 hypothetical protein VP496E541_P0123 [Vibrio phage 496E54-1]
MELLGTITSMTELPYLNVNWNYIKRLYRDGILTDSSVKFSNKQKNHLTTTNC